ncbi:MAG TPA: hypothetical protein VMV62_01240 [Candidatus Paceibacterota bacterium]|nr:hypothetical protein [Candidatus Paceibacterota bacterium]
MDDNKKFVSRLSPAEREQVRSAVSRIIVRDIAGLDVKKLHGYPDMFRVRTGRIRILYRQDAAGVQIVRVGFRSENTYKP